MEDRRNAAASSYNGRARIAIAGGGLRATSALRLLSDIDDLVVVAVCDADRNAPAMRLAEDVGVLAITEITELAQIPDLDVIVDLSDDLAVSRWLEAERPSGAAFVTGSAAELVWDLLIAKKRSDEQEKVFAELQIAYEKIRSHERRLQASKEALERANEELEDRLAEIFFTHEFFKALTRFSSVDDVTSLIVDGANGILGAEISAVYLFESGDWTLRLRASEGRPDGFFRTVIPVSETLLGVAFREGFVEQPDVRGVIELAGWATCPDEVRSHAAMPLRSGEKVVGVLMIASSIRRALTEAEKERVQVIANQSSLALQNALLHEELERLSVTDRLTGLYNHGYLHQRLEQEIERATRFGHSLSVIMLDIDDFKQFNDRHGHPMGDVVLKAVSEIIRENLREIDVAARYGGEEFMVVLPETDIEGALSVAERMRSSIEGRRHATADGERRAAQTASFGVAMYPLHAADASSLIQSADQALYRAKRTGKNKVVAAV